MNEAPDPLEARLQQCRLTPKQDPHFTARVLGALPPPRPVTIAWWEATPWLIAATALSATAVELLGHEFTSPAWLRDLPQILATETLGQALSTFATIALALLGTWAYLSWEKQTARSYRF